MKFKEFIIEENNKVYFSQKVSDILSALQDLNDSAQNMGVRHLVSNAQTIVNQIRRIIHTYWPQSEDTNLALLQKCGVAIMKTIEEKGDLQGILKSCQRQIEEIVGQSETPINQIGSDESK